MSISSIRFGKLHKKCKDEGKVVEGLEVEFIPASRTLTRVTQMTFKEEVIL